jgi:Protein of unknown function (DUF3309)
MNLHPVLVVLLILLLLSLFSGASGYPRAWGGWSWGPLGGILALILVLWLLGVFR